MAMAEGEVYVLLNPVSPAMVKIGRTSRSADQRARDLKTAAIPRHLVVLYSRRVSDCRIVESHLHRLFADRRIENSEWFNARPAEVIDALIEESRNYPVGPTPTDRTERRDILRDLRQRRGDDIDPNLQVATLEDDGVVISLRTVSADGVEHIDALDFIGDMDSDQPTLTPERPLSENARQFLRFDLFTLLMCTELINPARAEAIDRALNPYYQRPPEAAVKPGTDLPF